MSVPVEEIQLLSDILTAISLFGKHGDQIIHVETVWPGNDKKAPDAPKADTPKSDGVVMILANKPGEPAFQMKIEPSDKLSFKSDKLNEEPVSVEVKLENTTGKRQTFKAKCSLYGLVKIRPAIGFIEPGKDAKIMITLESKTVPENNKHFVEILSKSVCNDRVLYVPIKQPDGVKRLVCSFEKADGSQWPVAKKETII